VISFQLTEEQRLAQAMAAELAHTTLRPAARDADERLAIPPAIMNEIWAAGIVQSQADADAACSRNSPSLTHRLRSQLQRRSVS
jgi:hypothetical protein